MSNVLQKAICVVVGSLHCCMFVLATLYFRSCSLPSCRVITFCAHFHWQAFSFLNLCLLCHCLACGLRFDDPQVFVVFHVWNLLAVVGEWCWLRACLRSFVLPVACMCSLPSCLCLQVFFSMLLLHCMRATSVHVRNGQVYEFPMLFPRNCVTF